MVVIQQKKLWMSYEILWTQHRIKSLINMYCHLPEAKLNLKIYVLVIE